MRWEIAKCYTLGETCEADTHPEVSSGKGLESEHYGERM
jgi:hypothetical protein